MKKLLMGALLLLPLSAFAQENSDVPIYWASKPIQCSTPEKVVELMKKYGEVPTIIFEGNTGSPDGSQTPSRFVIATNPKTKTWTLLEFTGPTQGCILGSGQGEFNIGQSGTAT